MAARFRPSGTLKAARTAEVPAPLYERRTASHANALTKVIASGSFSYNRAIETPIGSYEITPLVGNDGSAIEVELR